jgi:uncharacterized OB-fold protein
MSAEVSDDELIALFPNVRVDHVNAFAYRGRLDRRLLVNRCQECGTWHEPPKPLCPRCWSFDVVAEPVSGRGTIYLVTFLHQGPAVAGVDYSQPYPVVTVDLSEQVGLRFTSTLVRAENDAIEIGKAVELDWIDRDGVPLPVFRLTEQPAS